MQESELSYFIHALKNVQNSPYVSEDKTNLFALNHLPLLPFLNIIDTSCNFTQSQIDILKNYTSLYRYWTRSQPIEPNNGCPHSIPSLTAQWECLNQILLQAPSLTWRHDLLNNLHSNPSRITLLYLSVKFLGVGIEDLSEQLQPASELPSSLRDYEHVSLDENDYAELTFNKEFFTKQMLLLKKFLNQHNLPLIQWMIKQKMLSFSLLTNKMLADIRHGRDFNMWLDEWEKLTEITSDMLTSSAWSSRNEESLTSRQHAIRYIIEYGFPEPPNQTDTIQDVIEKTIPWIEQKIENTIYVSCYETPCALLPKEKLLGSCLTITEIQAKFSPFSFYHVDNIAAESLTFFEEAKEYARIFFDRIIIPIAQERERLVQELEKELNSTSNYFSPQDQAILADRIDLLSGFLDQQGRHLHNFEAALRIEKNFISEKSHTAQDNKLVLSFEHLQNQKTNLTNNLESDLLEIFKQDNRGLPQRIKRNREFLAQSLPNSNLPTVMHDYNLHALCASRQFFVSLLKGCVGLVLIIPSMLITLGTLCHYDAINATCDHFFMPTKTMKTLSGTASEMLHLKNTI